MFKRSSTTNKGLANWWISKGEQTSLRVVEAMKGRNRPVAAIAAELDMSPSSVALHLKKLNNEKPRRAYIADWEPKTVTGGRAAPLWTAGFGENVEYVPQNRPGKKTSAAERREQVLNLLKIKPRTVKQLANAMHLVSAAAGRYVHDLRTPDNRQLFIKHWNHPSKIAAPGTGGDWAPVYAVGKRPDAPKPKQETPSERNRRLSKDPAYVADRRAYRVKRYQVEKYRKKPNSIFGALGI